ncbi:hypothetical protein J6590_085993 [Homalodisca vitripennis]|nr:hypothetical protein J6590_085993 [Homalodisca vitripennis]
MLERNRDYLHEPSRWGGYEITKTIIVSELMLERNRDYLHEPSSRDRYEITKTIIVSELSARTIKSGFLCVSYLHEPSSRDFCEVTKTIIVSTSLPLMDAGVCLESIIRFPRMVLGVFAVWRAFIRIAVEQSTSIKTIDYTTILDNVLKKELENQLVESESLRFAKSQPLQTQIIHAVTRVVPSALLRKRLGESTSGERESQVCQEPTTTDTDHPCNVTRVVSSTLLRKRRNGERESKVYQEQTTTDTDHPCNVTRVVPSTLLRKRQSTSGERESQVYQEQTTTDTVISQLVVEESTSGERESQVYQEQTTTDTDHPCNVTRIVPSTLLRKRLEESTSGEREFQVYQEQTTTDTDHPCNVIV